MFNFVLLLLGPSRGIMWVHIMLSYGVYTWIKDVQLWDLVEEKWNIYVDMLEIYENFEFTPYARVNMFVEKYFISM